MKFLEEKKRRRLGERVVIALELLDALALRRTARRRRTDDTAAW